MTLADFPALNASLNALSTVFIATGWALIRQERKTAHVACMCAAMVTSSGFLACYLWFHFHVPGGSIHFDYPDPAHPGPWRWVYYPLLITHVLLAFSVSAYTMPIWLYVSVTGVIVYMMLYQWFPSSEIRTKLHAAPAIARVAVRGS